MSGSCVWCTHPSDTKADSSDGDGERKVEEGKILVSSLKTPPRNPSRTSFALCSAAMELEGGRGSKAYEWKWKLEREEEKHFYVQGVQGSQLILGFVSLFLLSSLFLCCVFCLAWAASYLCKHSLRRGIEFKFRHQLLPVRREWSEGNKKAVRASVGPERLPGGLFRMRHES